MPLKKLVRASLGRFALMALIVFSGPSFSQQMPELQIMGLNSSSAESDFRRLFKKASCTPVKSLWMLGDMNCRAEGRYKSIPAVFTASIWTKGIAHKLYQLEVEIPESSHAQVLADLSKEYGPFELRPPSRSWSTGRGAVNLSYGEPSSVLYSWSFSDENRKLRRALIDAATEAPQNSSAASIEKRGECAIPPSQIFKVGMKLESDEFMKLADKNCPKARFHPDQTIGVTYRGNGYLIQTKRLNLTGPAYYQVVSVKEAKP